ncbi:hypothetical protein FRC08_016862, partial [Ceratobasidium sp. 394]
TRRPSEPRPTGGESKPRPTPGPSTVHETRHVPAPIKIPRMHVHGPSVTIERTPASPSKPANPSPNPNLNTNSTPTPTTGSSTSDSVISDAAPELVTILRAERASAVGFGLTLRPTEMGQLAARQDSATLPRDSYIRLSTLAPSPLSAAAGDASPTPVPPTVQPSTSIPPVSVPIPTPAPSTSVSPASSSKPLSTTNSPILRRSVSTDEGLAKARPGTIYARPGTEVMMYVMDGIVEGDVSGRPFPSSGAQEKGKGKEKEDAGSPLRVRSKTLAERGPRQRSATVDADFGTNPRASGVASGSHAGSGQVHMHSASGSNIYPHGGSGGTSTAHGPNIRRARSPSGATTLTHPSRPITPPDAFPADLVGKGLGAGMSTQAQVAGLALQSGSLGLSFFEPPSPLPAESPRVRTMRLQSAPNASGPLSSTAAPSKLSKFARSQLDSFSFLGTRGRSVSDTSATTLPVPQRERGWTVGAPLSPIAGDGESTPSPAPPVRPARPPSLTLQLDPPAPSFPPVATTAEEPRPALGRGNSGSSTGSGMARVGSRRLRRKRSSPRQGGSR